MSEIKASALRGFLVQDPRLTYQEGFSAALSSLTQAGASAGVPVPAQDTPMVLEATGAQTAGVTLKLRLQRSGMPGTARAIWRREGDTLWRGWDGPQVLSAFEFLSRATAPDARRRPHAITLPDRAVLVASDEDTGRRLRVYRRAPADGAWTSTEVYDDGSSSAYGLWPTLVSLGGQRVMVFSYREVGTDLQLRAWSSADGGVTWTKGQSSCLSRAIDATEYVPGRLRAALVDGSILLLAHLSHVGSSEDRLRQFASDDLGATFQTVTTMTGVSRGFPEILATDGGVVVAYLAYRSASAPNVLPYVRRLSSAWEDLSLVTSDAVDVSGALEWGTMSGSLINQGELASMRAEDGALYLLGRDHQAGAAGALHMVCSLDGGASWAAVGRNSDAPASGATPWAGDNASLYPRDLCATWQEGRALLFHRFAGGSASDSLCAAYLGGWATVEMPLKGTLTEDILDQIGWRRTWLPYAQPDAVSAAWVQTTTGAPTLTLGVTGLVISHGSGDAVLWRHALASGLADGGIAMVQIAVDGGVGYLELRISDGAGESYRVRLSASASAVTARDMEAGADIGSVATSAATGGICLLLALRKGGGSGRCAAWYRVGPTSSDRAWIEVGSSAALTAGTDTSARVELGTGQNAGTVVRLQAAAFVDGVYTGQQLTAQDNPGDLVGRTVGGSVYLGAGVSVRATDGPGFRGDVWEIAPRYARGVELLHPEVSASPRRRWRSEDTAEQVIGWEAGASAEAHGPMDRAMGVYLGGVNFRRAELQGRSGGVWSKLVDVDAGQGLDGLGFNRAGSVVRPNAAVGNDATTYLPLDTLRGGTFFNGTVARKIRSNTDGAWGPGVRRAAQLLLESCEASDAGAGTGGELWSPEVVAVFTTAATAAYDAYRLVIPAQVTAEGYFEIGVCLIGPVVVLGDGYGLGRSQGVAGSWEVAETRGGVRSYRAAAPVRRSVDVDWTEGVDASGVTQAPPRPDYLRATWGSGEIVAAAGAASYLVPGLYRFLSGALSPLVYLAGFKVDPVTVPASIPNRHRFLYGRIVSETLTVDAVLGEEWGEDGEGGEMMRVGKVRIEEEL